MSDNTKWTIYTSIHLFDYDGNTYTLEELQTFLIKKRREFEK